jgi:hypothetical protein
MRVTLLKSFVTLLATKAALTSAELVGNETHEVKVTTDRSQSSLRGSSTSGSAWKSLSQGDMSNTSTSTKSGTSMRAAKSMFSNAVSRTRSALGKSVPPEGGSVPYLESTGMSRTSAGQLGSMSQSKYGASSTKSTTSGGSYSSVASARSASGNSASNPSIAQILRYSENSTPKSQTKSTTTASLPKKNTNATINFNGGSAEDLLKLVGSGQNVRIQERRTITVQTNKKP